MYQVISPGNLSHTSYRQNNINNKLSCLRLFVSMETKRCMKRLTCDCTTCHGTRPVYKVSKKQHSKYAHSMFTIQMARWHRKYTKKYRLDAEARCLRKIETRRAVECGYPHALRVSILHRHRASASKQFRQQNLIR